MKSKKTLAFFMIFSITLTSMVPAFAASPTTQSSSITEEQLQIIDEGKNIAKKYEIGQPLSEKDLEFIQKYANKVAQNGGNGQVRPMDYASYSVFGTSRYGTAVEGDISGNFTADLGFINNSVYGDLKTYTVKGYVTQAKTDFQFVGYGPIGFNPPYVGKVADWTQSTGWVNGSSAALHISKNFTASITAFTAYPEGALRHSAGTLYIAGSY